MLLESFDHSCCLHGFCRVEFPTLGVFLRRRQPADPQADRPAEESAAIPSVEFLTFEVPTHFALLGGHLALLGIFLISFSVTPEFSSWFFKFVLQFLQAPLWHCVLVFMHAEPVLATRS